MSCTWLCSALLKPKAFDQQFAMCMSLSSICRQKLHGTLKKCMSLQEGTVVAACLQAGAMLQQGERTYILGPARHRQTSQTPHI